MKRSTWKGCTKAKAARCEPNHRQRQARKRFTMGGDYRRAAERERTKVAGFEPPPGGEE